ncbi:hypothetical protein K0M31_001912 [Melipona bicolor]|uniref:Uncharacterized protein n=1 Tax=Melipona bicolor TaxID=60889 RepID=A0AA40GGH9_9HYME|nr:hypothetical protein K0M31_001912 [Melipona bicolor]
MRWGTSGGAPKTRFLGTNYRSKWAWALYHSLDQNGDLRNDVDLYSKAQSESGVCNVAFKEEPTKTREIITTDVFPSTTVVSYV